MAYRSERAKHIFRVALVLWLALNFVVDAIPAVGWLAKIVVFIVTGVALGVWAFAIRVPNTASQRPG